MTSSRLEVHRNHCMIFAEKPVHLDLEDPAANHIAGCSNYCTHFAAENLPCSMQSTRSVQRRKPRIVAEAGIDFADSSNHQMDFEWMVLVG